MILPHVYLKIKSKHLSRNNARVNSKTMAIVSAIMTVVVFRVIVRLFTWPGYVLSYYKPYLAGYFQEQPILRMIIKGY